MTYIAKPKLHHPSLVKNKAGYTRPHTVHCGPEGIYVAALGNAASTASPVAAGPTLDR